MGKIEKILAIVDYGITVLRWIVATVKDFPKPPPGLFNFDSRKESATNVESGDK